MTNWTLYTHYTITCICSWNWRFIFLVSHTVSLDDQFWTFPDLTVLSSSESSSPKNPLFLDCLMLMMKALQSLSSISNHSFNTMPHPRRLESSASPLWKSWISHKSLLYKSWDYHSGEDSCFGFLAFDTTQSFSRLRVSSCRVSNTSHAKLYQCWAWIFIKSVTNW